MPTNDPEYKVDIDPETGKKYAPLVEIFSWTLDAWNLDLKRCKTNPDPSCFEVDEITAKSNKYVFVVTPSQSPPPQDSGLISSNGDVKDFITPIKQSFKLINEVSYEATGWKDYTNGKWGYSLKVPENFSITESEQTEAPIGKTLADIMKKDVAITGDYNGNYVIINLNIGSHDISDGKCDKGDFIKFLTSDNQNIEFCKGNDNRSDFYSSIVKADMFAQITGDKNKIKQTQDLFEKIILTLKFTN